MNLLTLLLLAFTGLSTAALNTTQMYRLKTKVKGHHPGKEGFNNLYLQSYHTGAGLSDITLTPFSNASIKGYLNPTNITLPVSYGNSSTPSRVYNAAFDLGNTFPWGLVMVPNSVFYSQWQPTTLNAGASGNLYTVSGFFINGTGLQWTSNPSSIGGGSDSFGGWIVCDWWHGALQLFFRISYYGVASTPLSCADVYLVPEYF